MYLGFVYISTIWSQVDCCDCSSTRRGMINSRAKRDSDKTEDTALASKCSRQRHSVVVVHAWMGMARTREL